MNIVDSSGWLEYFTDSPNATFSESPLKNQAELLIPVISANTIGMPKGEGAV